MYSILKRFILIFICAGFCYSLCSCSSRFIYRMDVRQGHYLTEENIKQLKAGMNKSQVQALFGSPAMTHVLNKDRWDYYYSFCSGTKDEYIEKCLSIYFKNDAVSHWE